MNCLSIQSEMEMGMISRASRISDEEDDEFSSQLDKMMNDAIKVSISITTISSDHLSFCTVKYLPWLVQNDYYYVLSFSHLNIHR